MPAAVKTLLGVRTDGQTEVGRAERGAQHTHIETHTEYPRFIFRCRDLGQRQTGSEKRQFSLSPWLLSQAVSQTKLESFLLQSTEVHVCCFSGWDARLLTNQPARCCLTYFLPLKPVLD